MNGLFQNDFSIHSHIPVHQSIETPSPRVAVGFVFGAQVEHLLARHGHARLRDCLPSLERAAACDNDLEPRGRGHAR